MDASKKAKSDSLVIIETSILRDRLNQVYKNRHLLAHSLEFDSLWDLKEKALLEKRSTVEVPDTWLNEIQDEHGERRQGS
ncbi:MAG: hypothetical protein IPL73_23165 [Candidatus Obscuribacter sp.]|nr:hypothetical protein [Candidatus Obscuribacter sp.]